MRCALQPGRVREVTRKRPTWLTIVSRTLFRAAYIGFSLAFSCASPPPCDPNARRECVGDNDCTGHQTCTADGSGYGECECTERIVPSSVGTPCLRDADCASDETCLDGDEDTFLGGVPAVAVCTLPCDEDPSLCERRDPPSTCVITDDRGTEDPSDDRAHCLEACTIGTLSAEKCRGNEGLVCATVDSLDSSAGTMRSPGSSDSSDAGSTASSSAEGVCRPLCSRDADCSPNVCNLRTGACEARENRGEAFGTECDPDASESTCEGVCVEVDGAAFCSHRCWFGSTEDCGDEGAAMASGLCRFPEEPSGLIGDAGFCAVLCDTDADCDHPGLRCDAFDAELRDIVGRSGVCVPN